MRTPSLIRRDHTRYRRADRTIPPGRVNVRTRSTHKRRCHVATSPLQSHTNCPHERAHAKGAREAMTTERRRPAISAFESREHAERALGGMRDAGFRDEEIGWAMRHEEAP